MSEPITIAAPYPEGGAMELARAAEEAGLLAELVMPSRRASRVAADVAARVGRGDAARRLRRGAGQVRALHEITPSFEPLRLASPLLVVGPRLADIHRLKAVFDRGVARLDLGDAAAVVAMPEAALATFQRNADRLRVFHEVDGHPRARNEVLERFYGRDRAAGEAHTVEIVERIEAELALADLVLSPSRAVTDQMVQHGVPPEKLLEAHLGVDLDAFTFPETGGTDRSRTRPVVLYVGQISLRKGIPFLLDAARGRKVEVRLIGPMVDPSALAGAPDNVRYEGAVSHAAVAEAMRTADAFVLPTLEDAFGLVVVEAAASGLPVISTSGAGAAEVLRPEDLVTVPVGDPSALATALDAVSVLSTEQRVDRAERIRNAGRSGTLNDWAAWSGAVLEGIAARV
jgi:glycosyltransferase involved in cell wall biosynthesis